MPNRRFMGPNFPDTNPDLFRIIKANQATDRDIFQGRKNRGKWYYSQGSEGRDSSYTYYRPIAGEVAQGETGGDGINIRLSEDRDSLIISGVRKLIDALKSDGPARVRKPSRPRLRKAAVKKVKKASSRRRRR